MNKLKKITLILFFILVFNLNVMAYDNVAKEIKDISSLLKSKDDFNTVINIDNWIDDNFEYQFFYRIRGMREIWRSKQLDCTGKSMLKRMMYKYNNIKVRYVYGYADNNKHDWVEFNIDGSWQHYESFNDLKKIGYGQW